MESSAPQLKKRRVSLSEGVQEIRNGAVPVPPLPNLLVKRLSEKGRLPTRGSALSAGYDLYR
jgi:dUTP pyrophosphatase